MQYIRKTHAGDTFELQHTGVILRLLNAFSLNWPVLWLKGYILSVHVPVLKACPVKDILLFKLSVMKIM